MLREEYIRLAANEHIAGTRFLRDTAASLLSAYTLDSCRAAFDTVRLVEKAESLMSRAVSFAAGLMNSSGVTKFTAVAEARMRLLGVELSASLTQRQSAAERVRDVPPGTRGDVFDGLVALSTDACKAAGECAAAAEKLMGEVREGRTVSAVPFAALVFLKRLCNDYGAVCDKLSTCEQAELIKRCDEAERLREALVCCARAQGVNAADTSVTALASLSSSGLIPNIPPVLFDLLLRYDSLSPTASSPI